MNTKQRRLRLIILIPVVILILDTNLFYYWIKLAGWTLFVTGLVSLICYVTIIIGTIVLIIRLIRWNELRNIYNYSTILGLAGIIVLLSIFPLFKVNKNTFQSPVKIKACYEGTMNTSHLYLRENGEFENFSIGWFAFVHYYKGTWRQHEDTLTMNYEKEKPNLLSEKMIIYNGYLYNIHEDTLITTNYYIGDCKGEN
jgi:hypothetical protein